MEQTVFAEKQVGQDRRHPADDIGSEDEQRCVNCLYVSCHLLTIRTRGTICVGAVMSGALVVLAELQSTALVATDDREDVCVDDEHQQQRREEQDRELCSELEVYHEAANRSTHTCYLVQFFFFQYTSS